MCVLEQLYILNESTEETYFELNLGLYDCWSNRQLCCSHWRLYTFDHTDVSNLLVNFLMNRSVWGMSFPHWEEQTVFLAALRVSREPFCNYFLYQLSNCRPIWPDSPPHVFSWHGLHNWPKQHRSNVIFLVQFLLSSLEKDSNVSRTWTHEMQQSVIENWNCIAVLKKNVLRR